MVETLGPLGQQHQTLEAMVCEELRKQIILGQRAPGTRLVESSIAEELGVSRGPVREAIRTLDREGFVAISPRRGATVADVSVAEALECYEVRIVLEGLAARLAAERRTDADLAEIRLVLTTGQELLDADRWDALANLNNELHVALAKASGNRQLVDLMSQYAKRIAWMFARSAPQRGHAAWVEHAGIVDAIERRDGDGAEEKARRHIERSREQFLVAIAAGVPWTVRQ